VRFFVRTLQRVAVLGLGVLSVWLIVFVFRWVDSSLPWIVALSVSYGIAAYLILPRAVRMGLKILQRRHVPRFTVTSDGLPGDPVSVDRHLGARTAFATAGWTGADPLGLASSWRMARAFVLNEPYPTAPFSTLYLFGRGQDIGFQRAIDDSPRKRHHVRFWAKSLAQVEADVDAASFWLNTDRPNENDCVLWVGAATKDIGFSLTRLTFQVTHATASDTNAERGYIVNELRKSGVIENVTFYKTADKLVTKNVNHYVNDGEVAIAELIECRSELDPESGINLTYREMR